MSLDLDIQKDAAARTLTVTSRFAAPVERVWQLFADPRQLEQWWGPPTYPATFVDHDLRPGGRCSYFMTSPEGVKHPGWWRIIDVQAPHLLEHEDGFSDESGEPDPSMPTCVMRCTLTADGPGTVMTLVTTYPTTEAMERMVGMGMVEGLSQALGQIPAILAA